MPCRRQTSAKAAALYWAPLSVWKTTPWTPPPRAATAISIASVTSEVRMWSAIDQPTTFLEQMSITGARSGPLSCDRHVRPARRPRSAAPAAPAPATHHGARLTRPVRAAIGG
ncbi:hypothetical protein GCM10014715_55600 [Streptomyces spiralis]|uniref:Uncharacterized protein n=1 Tax=Streptomyces spiralis TaxID=66376 RepID=A0A919DXY9_9ACTN|nr:hypothetical protein GCM10014715_55600 [Streptomyces spiralis]